MAKKTIADIDWTGKRALLRVDFNVPMERGTTVISDDSRVRAALPTIAYLREHGAALVMCTHLGRPGGTPQPELELGPVARRLSELVEAPVHYVHDCVGETARAEAAALEPGEVLLLENLRFYPGEEANSPAFALRLAQLADVYVNDAFGAAHRAHASTEGVAHHLPPVARLLMEREVAMLGSVMEDPPRPLAVVLGGAKVSDKLAVLERLVTHADALFIGGGVAATCLLALGYGVGRSLVEGERVNACTAIMERSVGAGVPLHLPKDVVVAEEISPRVECRTVPVDRVPDGWSIVDIGPETVEDIASKLKEMKTVVWNGPMGVFEVPPFDRGTAAVARALADSDAMTIIGGGSTVEAVAGLGLTDRMSHVSTGGGASLEFLEGKTLPGVAALEDR